VVTRIRTHACEHARPRTHHPPLHTHIAAHPLSPGQVLLDPPAPLLRARLAARAAAGSGHFMPPLLLESQLTALERPPAPGGSRYACCYDCAAEERQGHGDRELVECTAKSPPGCDSLLMLHITGLCKGEAAAGDAEESGVLRFPCKEECVLLITAALRKEAGGLI
jgi:hypothetical protein